MHEHACMVRCKSCPPWDWPRAVRRSQKRHTTAFLPSTTSTVTSPTSSSAGLQGAGKEACEIADDYYM